MEDHDKPYRVNYINPASGYWTLHNTECIVCFGRRSYGRGDCSSCHGQHHYQFNSVNKACGGNNCLSCTDEAAHGP